MKFTISGADQFVHLGLFMSLRSIKLFVSALITALLLAACGGESAPAPGGVSVTNGESSVTVSWNMDSGVEYWLFFGPSSLVPVDTASMKGWIGLPGGGTLINVSSPYVVGGLFNGYDYSFSINGRTNGGPGGAGSVPKPGKPRIAGQDWTSATAVFAGDLRTVVYGGAAATTITASTLTYLAAGTGGTMFSSADGSTWVALSANSNVKAINGATYLGGVYTLVGDTGVILRSSDLITWTAPTTVPSSVSGKNLNAVANNGVSLTVSVGAGGTILASADGLTWTAATFSGTAPTADLYAVTYSPLNVGTNTAGTWMAVGAGGVMLQSADGLNWATLTSVTTVDLRGIAYGLSSAALPVFVAVGNAGTVVSSADGVTWAAKTLAGVSANLNAVSFATQFVVVGDAGKTFYSTDGVAWSPSTSAVTSNNLFAVAHGMYAYSAVGALGTNLLSK